VKQRPSKTTFGLAVFLAVAIFIASRVARSGPSAEYVSAESSFTLRFDGGTSHNGRLRGLGLIKIGDVGGGATEVFVTAAVDASGGFQ
jgi:hypothetical protein